MSTISHNPELLDAMRAELEAVTAADRIEALEVAMRDLGLTAVLLLQNSQACVAQHHGSTSQPGWLRDCRLKQRNDIRK